MHDDQIDISSDQVTALISDQIPHLAGVNVVAVAGAGTVHSIYRIGESVAARFPLRRDDPGRVLDQLRREMAAASEFARACPMTSPVPLHLGSPGHGYPLPWTTQTWLPGSIATPRSCERSVALAEDLSILIQSLRDWDTGGRHFQGTGRGGSLPDHDVWVDECIRRSDGLFDSDALRTMWGAFRRLPREDPDVMCHTDLIPSNLLVSDGHVAGVLDSGGFQSTDPALDLVSAWHLLSDAPREQLREALDCGDLQWERGKAWAFEQAVGLPWYYQESNPAMAELGRTTLHRLLADS